VPILGHTIGRYDLVSIPTVIVIVEYRRRGYVVFAPTKSSRPETLKLEVLSPLEIHRLCIMGNEIKVPEFMGYLGWQAAAKRLVRLRTTSERSDENAWTVATAEVMFVQNKPLWFVSQK
jgi:hypothetical protein